MHACDTTLTMRHACQIQGLNPRATTERPRGGKLFQQYLTTDKLSLLPTTSGKDACYQQANDNFVAFPKALISYRSHMSVAGDCVTAHCFLITDRNWISQLA